jgi:murein L,D-transpeptidase YcbB/YkuD
MKLILNILLLSVFVTFMGCRSDSSFFGEEVLTLNEQLENRIGANSDMVFYGDALLSKNEIIEFYSQNNYEPLWVNDSSLNKNGENMVFLVENAYNYGLLPEFFHHLSIQKSIDSSLLDTELMLTNSFFLYVTHLSVGFLDTMSMQYSWKKDSIDFDVFEAINKVSKSENLILLIESYQPKHWEYNQLQKGLQKFMEEYELDTAHFTIPNFKDDSTNCYNVAKEALVAHHFLETEANDVIFIKRLKDFQLINGLIDDAIVGKWTGRVLSKSNTDRFYQAMLSLEKWRWKESDEMPDRYVRVNIPAYTFKFWNNNEVIRKHRVIVGAYATQTPEFHATLRRFITNPFWHLPYSIASTESLTGVKKDSAYFSKRGMKIFRDGAEIDPNTVNWNAVNNTNFRYRVRQDGGGSNSLGRIKFLFPNHHSVYFHDTPTKRLFKNDIRAYSHGCVRLHLPFDFAKSLIEVDQLEIPADTLDSLIQRGTQRVVELNTAFEVYIEYYTATGDSLGNITFHPDIYGRDERFLVGIKKEFGE